MPIVTDNNFARDSHGLRGERLNSIQGNFATIQPELQAPANIETWAADCYTVFLETWTTAGLEANEKEGAAIDVQMKGDLMEDEYQNARNLGMTSYHDDPVHLKDFNFDVAYPDKRNDQIERVNNVLRTHQRHVTEGITHLIPGIMITRLTNAMNDFIDALNNQDKERTESEHATAALYQKMESDGDILRSLKSWWYAMMGKNDQRIGFIGMVNPKYGTGGGQPDAPQNLEFDSVMSRFTWIGAEGATSYQLAYRTTGSGDDWEEAYKGPETSATFNPGGGNWQFRVRARNEHGYGDWSNTVTVEIAGGIPAPDWLTAVYYPAPFPIPTPPPKILPEHVLLEWGNVAEATMYEVWRSVVDVGAPAGVFTLLEDFNEEMYHDFAVTLNKRNYYYIVAKNATDRSVASTGAWAETVE